MTTKTQQPTHTPGPWVSLERPGADHLEIHEPDNEFFTIARVRGFSMVDARANAAFIVRACNCHDDMLAVLKQIKIRLHFVGMPQEARDEFGRPDWAKEIAMIEAAIAKTEGVS